MMIRSFKPKRLVQSSAANQVSTVGNNVLLRRQVFPQEHRERQYK